MNIPYTTKGFEEHFLKLSEYIGIQKAQKISNASQNQVTNLIKEYKPTTTEWFNIEAAILLTQIEQLSLEELLLLDHQSHTIANKAGLVCLPDDPTKVTTSIIIKKSESINSEDIAEWQNHLEAIGKYILKGLIPLTTPKLLALELLASNHIDMVLPELIRLHPHYLSCTKSIHWLYEARITSKKRLQQVLSHLNCTFNPSPRSNSFHTLYLYSHLLEWAENKNRNNHTLPLNISTSNELQDMISNPAYKPKELVYSILQEISPTLSEMDDESFYQNIVKRGKRHQSEVLKDITLPEIIESKKPSVKEFMENTGNIAFLRKGNDLLFDHIHELAHNAPAQWKRWRVIIDPLIPQAFSTN